jgi:glutathione S-transferase
MEVEYLTVVLDPSVKKDLEQIEKLKSNVPLCRFPVLEIGQSYISESLSVAKYFSNNKLGFYGPD